MVAFIQGQGMRVWDVASHTLAAIHVLSGYASQQDRKAKWLRTTNGQTCFVAEEHLRKVALLVSNFFTDRASVAAPARVLRRQVTGCDGRIVRQS